MPIRRATAALTLVGVGLLTALPGCRPAEPAAPPPGPVTIGLLVDRDSPAGDQAVSAARLAVDLINHAHPELRVPLAPPAGPPGLAGAPLALVTVDTAGDPAGVETAMESAFAEQQLAGFVAAESAEVVATAGAYADRRALPLVDGASSADFLLEVGLDWYFRVTPSDRVRGDAVRRLLGGQLAGAGSGVTVLAPAGAGAEAAALRADFDRAGEPAVTATVLVDDDQFAVAEAAAALAATAPTPVVAIAATGDEAALLREVIDSAGGGRALAGMGAGFRAGPPAGMVYPVGWSAELAQRHPLARSVADRYLEQHQTPMTELAAGVFTATMTIASAIDAAGSGDPAAVRAALRQLSLPATQMIVPWRGVRFGDDGQNLLAAAVVEQHAPGGAALVHPPELAVTDPQWPRPAAGDSP